MWLLDEDDELAAAVPPGDRIPAWAATAVRVVRAAPGPCDLGPGFAAAGEGGGLLVLGGLIAAEMEMWGRTVTELVGEGDVMARPEQRTDELVVAEWSWRVLSPVRLAVIDEELTRRLDRWPELALSLGQRAWRRTGEAETLRGIASHPRLEVRLALLLWHLASRWGRVDPAGLHLTLPLTHRLLGQLVAAERPSITHAMTRLIHLGLVSGGTGDLRLHGTFDEHLAVLAERTHSG